MLRAFRSLFTKSNSKPADDGQSLDIAPPQEIAAGNLTPFPLASQLANHNGLPILNWETARAWVEEGGSKEEQAQARAACERAWLMHFRQALGPGYTLAESESAILLSSVQPNVVQATLEFMEKTHRRIAKVLDGIARISPESRHILILFDDVDTCHGYGFHAAGMDSGDFTYSGAMHIDTGCSHYVAVKADLRSLEPVIAHQMTHGCLSHLPLPRWLNEGLAINTERRVVGRSCGRCRQLPLLDRHLAYWREEDLSAFWNGQSFSHPDDGQILAYDLARMLVERLARDWEAFRHFVLAADRSDAGAGAAQRHLGVDLREEVSSLFSEATAGS